MSGNLVDGSVLLNSILGGTLFLLGTFLTKYYFLEFVRRVHGKTMELDSLRRGLVQGVFSMIPYLIFHVFCLDTELVHRHEISAGLTFLNLASFLSTVVLLSPKNFRFNKFIFNSISAYTLFSFFLSVTATIKSYGAVISAVAQALNTVFWIRAVKTFNLEPIQDFNYIRSRSLGSLIHFFKNILYPFEIMLDYSLVLNSMKNKTHVLSFSTRSFISPYINVSLFLLYWRLDFSLRSMIFISLLTFCFAIFLTFCSRKPRLYRYISFYSFAVLCGYFYLIIKEQVRITWALSRLFRYSFPRTVLFYIVPQICFFSLVVNTHFYSIGLRQVSMYSALISNTINLTFLIGISSAIALSSFYSILDHKTTLLALAMSGLLYTILIYYVKFCNGRLIKDFAFLSLFLIGVYYWCLYKTG